MKIHKLNREGTMAVVIPKDTAEILGWKIGQDVLVVTTENDYEIKIVNKTLKQPPQQVEVKTKNTTKTKIKTTRK